VPTYVYRCRKCGTTLERRQGFQDPPLTECEECSGELYRVLQPVQVIFKGSGFYSTDYRAKNPAESEPKPASTSTDEKTESSSKTESGSKTESSAKKTETPAAAGSSNGSSKSD